MEIKFNNVNFSYPNTEILCNVNCTFKNNTITALIGKTGSGKSTMFDLIVNILKPLRGEIQVGDFILSKDKKLEDEMEFRKKISLMYQYPEKTFMKKTVYAELMFSIGNYNMKYDITTKISNSLKMVGLPSNYLDKNINELSNTEKRKLALACCLITNPSLLLLDEPTIGLDSYSKKTIITILKKLKTRYKKTIIIITHDIDTIYPFIDDVVVLGNKEILLAGNKYEVFNKREILEKNRIAIPKITEFCNVIKENKNIELGNFDDIKELMKEIYRNV